jgi:methionyl-tRNA formyltransferase
MRIAFLTTADPLYLPAFFERVLDAYAAQTHAVYVVPPLYKNQTPIQAALRFRRTFGIADARRLAVRTAGAALRRRSIARVAAERGVRCIPAADVNAPSFLAGLRAADVDLIVSVSCPQIFKTELINLPALGCLNIHGALLPRYRGVLPSFWMLANGEQRAGVSIYFVNEAIDAGDLCAQRSFEIKPEDTLDSLLRKSKAAAADLLLEVLRSIESEALTRLPLDLAAGSYHSWPDSEAVQRFRAAGRRLW